MKCPIEVRCLNCHRSFCCANCRWNHEQSAHGLEYDCQLCRGHKFLCRPESLRNASFLQHITDTHLPLHCNKCKQLFVKMEDFNNVNQCNSVSELIDKELAGMNETQQSKEIDDRFDSLYERTTVNLPNDGDNFEAIVSVNKSDRTAVITPIIRQKHIVDYDSSDSDTESASKKVIHTPYPNAPKTPKLKRVATPHVKKFLIRQNAIERGVEFDHEEFVDNNNESSDSGKITPSRDKNGVLVTDVKKEMTTPTHLPVDRCNKIVSSAVTTSTPTHPAGTWSMFPEQGADSPLSEIEGTSDSPAQSIDTDGSKAEKSDNLLRKLKSIIVTGSKIRIESQDSSEKQVTFQESGNSDGSSLSKIKKVTFAEDTVFKQENKANRVFRKPKRMLTPGPQKPNRFCYNPRFQALINRFESHGRTIARTPIANRDVKNHEQTTPPIGEHIPNIQARAINFKEDSHIAPDVYEEKEITANELFKSCIDSPAVNSNVAVSSAITSLTTNIAGSLQNCLRSALQTAEEETEIQFKFIITKRTVSVKRIVDDGKDVDEKSCEVKMSADSNKENIWSSVARAVKKVFWGEHSINPASRTPISRSYSSNDSSASSASKRKTDDLSDSDLSPINHKRHKFEGRIRGRPPLPRCKPWPVSSLKVCYSADQGTIVKELSNSKDDMANQSF